MKVSKRYTRHGLKLIKVCEKCECPHFAIYIGNKYLNLECRECGYRPRIKILNGDNKNYKK